MNPSDFRILVVDDEPKYVFIVQLNLEDEGYEVITAHNGHKAIELTTNQQPDLIILDVRMPGIDGYETCRRIRQFSLVPIIMLTAKAEDADKIQGLDLGADDYVAKPFSMGELLSRVQAVLRRVERMEMKRLPIFQIGELKVNLTQQRIFIGGQEIKLTQIEYSLLSTLIEQAGRVIGSDRLLEAAWGVGYEGEDRVLWQAMYRLRKKIEPDPKAPQYIQVRPGLGYMFVIPDREK
ncbi:MAG: response regulator transcription factor [Chloroflexi bacterium]|nr:response regulator transcription factor [Chloroflexota bacterium]